MKICEPSAASKARCEVELARPPFPWKRISIDDVNNGHNKKAPGMFYDLEFPWTEAMLYEFGAEWLTKAFHRAGTLDKDNKVTKIVTEDDIKITTGNNGGKFLFEVEYEKPSPELHTKIFCKIPFPLEGATKTDRLSSSVNKQPMEYCEINFSRLLEGIAPMKIPKMYYGDISNDSTNWILMTECIEFAFDELNYGHPGEKLPQLPPYKIEGPYDKALDAANLRGPSIDYYMALAKRGGMLAGLHKAGKILSDEVLVANFGGTVGMKMEHFGMNPAGVTGAPPNQMSMQIASALRFFEQAKVVFPEYISSDEFKTRFKTAMMTLNAYRSEVNYWRDGSDPDFVAFCHGNMNVDNAYFWREEDGSLDVGVLDWGGVSASALGFKMWWWFYCQEYESLKENHEALLQAFIDTYHEHGGPYLDLERLKNQFMVTAMEQMLGLIAAIPQMNRMCKPAEWNTIADRYDPRIHLNIDGKSSLRQYLHVMNHVIRMIMEWDADKVLQKGFVEDFWVGEMGATAKANKIIGLEEAPKSKPQPKEAPKSKPQPKEKPSPKDIDDKAVLEEDKNDVLELMKSIGPTRKGVGPQFRIEEAIRMNIKSLDSPNEPPIGYLGKKKPYQQRTETYWRQPIPEEFYGGQSGSAYGERSIRKEVSPKVESPYSGGTVAIALGGDSGTESVDIDKLHGPILLCPDGSTEFLNTGRKWSSLHSADQKAMAYQAAQRNKKMRPVIEQHFADIEKQKQVKEWLALSESERRVLRCKQEQAKAPVWWQPITADVVMKNHTKYAPGIIYGLEFPWNEDELEKMGPSWLTQAFHTAGSLESTNEVIKLTINRRITIDAGNNAGKFLFEVKYRYPREDLHEKLFVKCPFKMNKDTQSDRISSSVLKQPMDLVEINTYRLIEGNIPKPTPKFYFGDISNETSNYILITECLAYTGYSGVSKDAVLKPYEIEGPYDKCMDWQLRGPAKDYYMVIVKAHAMIGGMDKAGKLAPDHVKRSGLNYAPGSAPHDFGCRPNASSGEDPSMYKNKVATAVTFFSQVAKVLFPEYATTEEFKTKFTETMFKWSAYSKEIIYFKNGYDQDYCAFGHLNLNADNAYFWKNDDGELECGIIDWGGFGYNNLGHKIWWTFNCADYDNFKDNLDDYLDAFLSTYEEFGGPKLDKKVLKTCFLLTVLENTNFMVSAVPNCYRQCPSDIWPTIKDRHDPRIAANVQGKSTLRTTWHVMSNGIRVLEEMKLDEVLENWIQDFYVEKMKRAAKTEEMIYSSVPTL